MIRLVIMCSALFVRWDRDISETLTVIGEISSRYYRHIIEILSRYYWDIVSVIHIVVEILVVVMGCLGISERHQAVSQCH